MKEIDEAKMEEIFFRLHDKFKRVFKEFSGEINQFFHENEQPTKVIEGWTYNDWQKFLIKGGDFYLFDFDDSKYTKVKLTIYPKRVVIEQSNFPISKKNYPKMQTCKIAKEREFLQEKIGFNIDKYVGIDKRKLLRNCVLPELGLHIFQCVDHRQTTEKTLFG
jgi:hypothetical protein